MIATPKKEVAPIGTASLLYQHLYSYIPARHIRRANFLPFFGIASKGISLKREEAQKLLEALKIALEEVEA